MRMIHTSDWHLGRLFFGESLTEEQAALLNEFVAVAKETKPDVILIAGDVYDRSVPAADKAPAADPDPEPARPAPVAVASAAPVSPPPIGMRDANCRAA